MEYEGGSGECSVGDQEAPPNMTSAPEEDQDSLLTHEIDHALGDVYDSCASLNKHAKSSQDDTYSVPELVRVFIADREIASYSVPGAGHIGEVIEEPAHNYVPPNTEPIECCVTITKVSSKDPDKPARAITTEKDSPTVKLARSLNFRSYSYSVYEAHHMFARSIERSRYRM